MAQKVKNLPAMQETWVQFLHWEDPLEEGMATPLPPVFLPGEFPWTEEGLERSDWQATVHRVAELDRTEAA